MFKNNYFALVLVAILFSLGGCAPDLSTEDLLARAEKAIESDDLSAAEIDLKSVLRNSPEHPRGRALYGLINTRRLEADAAVEQFERSLAALETIETRVQFAKALVQAGESAELVSEWRQGSFVTVEGESQFQAALTRAFLAQAQPEEARAALERALAADADDAYVGYTHALVLLQLDRDQESATSILEAIVQSDADDARAWSLLGLLAWQNKDFANAESYYEKAAAANPYRLGDRIQLVETQVRLGKADVASANLSQLEAQLRNYPAIRFLRAQLLFDEGNYEGAIDLFNQILSVSPDNPGALLLAANANARVNKLAIARRHLERFLNLQPGNVQATLQLAQVNALLGESGKTEELARSLLEADDNNVVALTLLANALAAQGMHAESADVFQKLAGLEPGSTQNLVALGSQQIVAGDIEAGVAQLEGAVDQDPDNVLARERLIEAKLVAQDLPGAAKEAATYVEASPESARALVYSGRVALQMENNDAARANFEKALELDSQSIPARGGLAALAIMGQDLDGAKVEFQKALEANPGNLLASMNLAVILERMGDSDGTERVLLEAIDANPAAVAPRVAIAKRAINEKKPSIAIDQLSPEPIAAQKDFEALRTLTAAYILAGQKELASNSAKELLGLRDSDPSALALAARASMLSQDFSDAQGYIEQALLALPNATPLRKLLIESLVMQDRLDLAGVELDKLPPDVQKEAPVLKLRGRIALAQNDADTAVDLLAQAFDGSPSDENRLLLSSAQWLAGERDTVVKDLGDWLEAHPDAAQVRAVLAARLIEVGDEAAASAQYAVLIDSGIEDTVVLNNMAWLLRKEQSDLALEYIQRADRLAPDSPSIKDTYAMVELERGEFTRALSLNQRALDAAPDAQDILLNRARILAAAGRSSEAGQIIEGILASADSSVKEQARVLMESLK